MIPKEIKQNNNEKSTLSASVLERIENENVSPRSRWIFECMNYGVWMAWAASLVFGAISVAVLIYVGDHTRFALFEATHDTPLSFFAEVLPYIWIITFIGMGSLAYFNMRHTKCGYRYPMWQLMISSVVLSAMGGVILNVFGVGYLIDTQLDKRMPTYRSLEHAEERMWQNAAEGRLLGVFTSMDQADEMYLFIDTEDTQWSIETTELRDEDRKILSSRNTVRILGTTTDAQAKIFHACGVFPWMFDKDVSVRDMRKDRRVFVERMYEHMEAQERLSTLENEVFSKDKRKPFKEGICADIAVVKRMKF
ncbi:MAG: hypothetical protein ACI92I_000754 [Acidimicrobiales bacterium]|jgi:hypothetical protein